jgi:NAD(P)H-dependent flavin oxidoreductase YrpB (nitropropane dioxygenase family)
MGDRTVNTHTARRATGAIQDRLRQTRIIQGGMGIGVSGWELARAVSMQGQLGVVSGVGLSHVVPRILQNGDPGGHIRRAFAAFPVAGIADRVLGRYFVEGGAEEPRFRPVPLPTVNPSPGLRELTAIAVFSYVWLAKEGHDGLVGVNFLEKVQTPLLESFYGAMLADVDAVLMGAGIPTQVPAILDALAEHDEVSYRITVEGAMPEDDFRTRFDPKSLWPDAGAPLTRPVFLAIVSSVALAKVLQKRAPGTNGYVVEGPTAGGHNAPPRGKREDGDHRPLYGDEDVVDFSKLRELGLPYWIAGSQAHPDALARATREHGACGVQMGSIFAFCRESGMDEAYKREVRRQGFTGDLDVKTSNLYSPTGFPFKAAHLPGTVSEEPVYEDRRRICDMGLLRNAYRKPDGTLGYRCPAEPVDVYLAKGGKIEDTVGRRCLCNSLTSAVGLPQTQKFPGRDAYAEPAFITSGDDLDFLTCLMNAPEDTYSARDAVDYMLGRRGPAGP